MSKYYPLHKIKSTENLAQEEGTYLIKRVNTKKEYPKFIRIKSRVQEILDFI